MLELAKPSLFSSSFIPHGHCYLWKPGLVGLHIVSDALIALAYYSIPILLIYFVRRRRDVPFDWIFVMFGVFIVACGTTHLMDIWTLWHPSYWLSGGLKAITALASVATAVSLVPLLPQALALPSPAQLETTNLALTKEITEHRQAEQAVLHLNAKLEQRVEERTAALMESNQNLLNEIVERQRVEVELRRSLKELSDVKFALDKAAIVVATDPQGTITDVNEKFCQLSQYAASELMGQNHRIVNSGYHSAAFFQNLWQTIARGQVWHGEIRNRAKDGSHYWVDTTIVPFLNDDGKPFRYLAIRFDMTDRKLAEQQIHDLNQDLERRVQERTQQLLAANRELEAFSYSVSHDLRSPLRSIDGFSQALLERHADQLDTQGKHYLQRVRAASQRMGQLIDDLLQLSRVTRSTMVHQPVDLSAIAQTIVSELQQTQPERKVTFAIAPNLTAEGDPHLLRIVLDNLLNNAWKFTSHHDQAQIELGAIAAPGQPTTYFVRDDGAGFDMNYAHKLFGAFQRLHAMTEFPGNGVGLATIQRVIHRHGGQIWAEAAVEQGATFYFTLESSPELPTAASELSRSTPC